MATPPARSMRFGSSVCPFNYARMYRRPIVFGIRLDRFDDPIQFIGAIDLARTPGAWLCGLRWTYRRLHAATWRGKLAATNSHGAVTDKRGEWDRRGP